MNIGITDRECWRQYTKLLQKLEFTLKYVQMAKEEEMIRLVAITIHNSNILCDDYLDCTMYESIYGGLFEKMLMCNPTLLYSLRGSRDAD
jgi:hypothetical protein